MRDMRSALAISLLLLVPLALPVGAADFVHDRNVAFLWSIVGDQDPAQQVTMHDGRTTTLAEAIDDAAARASTRGIDLASVATGASRPPPPVDALDDFGDVWILEYGTGACTAKVLAPGSPAFVALDPQTWLYAGGIGWLSTTNGAYTSIISWALKTSEVRMGTNGFTAFGNQDFYCFSFSGLHFAFPFVNGWAWYN